MINDKLDAEIAATEKAIEAAKQVITTKEREVISLSGTLSGLLFARNLRTPAAGTPKAAIQVKQEERLVTNGRSKTGNPPVAEMILTTLRDSTKRLPYSELCQRIVEKASNPVSPKTVSSTLTTLKKQGKVDHSDEGYAGKQAA